MRRFILIVATCVALVAGGSSTGIGSSAAAAPRALRVLVTNDDGIGAPGMDALVRRLRKLDRVNVIVVAPATNQSGTSDKTTPGPLTTAPATTTSGYPAIAVQGYPADAVNFALDGGIKTKPHLVASGVNEGSNPGPVVKVSGTVGAARTAVRRVVPAVAISQGGDAPDYASGAREAVRWVKKHRNALTKKGAAAPTEVANINVPTCTVGKVRGLVEVPSATGGDITAPSDCTSKLTNPPDDVIGLANGYATLSKVPPD